MLHSERQAVADAARRLAGLRMAPGTSSNVSLRNGERVAISPTGCELGRLVADEVAVIDDAGTLLHGPREPTSELALHLAVYDRTEAGAVVHVHPPVGTALAAVIDELPALHYQAVELGGPVRVARYETFGTPALATVTVDALEGRNAVIMANHGTLTHGGGLDEAVRRAITLEWLCELYWRAASVAGRDRVRSLDEAQLQAVRDEMSRRRYGAQTGALQPSP